MCDFKEDTCPAGWPMSAITMSARPVGELTEGQKWDAAKKVTHSLAEYHKLLADRLGDSGAASETRAVQHNLEKLFDFFESMDGIPLKQRTFSV
jgi:hypothetical protein